LFCVVVVVIVIVIISVNLYEYAATVNINLPSPRIDAYMESNYDALQRNVINWAGKVLYKIGFNQVIFD
jgi:hypothetical protein